MYLIYSIKHGGWYGKTGQFTSNPEHAKRLPRERAIAQCTLQLSDSQMGCIPVAEADIEEILL